MAELGWDDGTAATAEYIHGMAKELQVLASRSHLDFLSYLLAMVEQEALRVARPADRAERGRAEA